MVVLRQLLGFYRMCLLKYSTHTATDNSQKENNSKEKYLDDLFK